MKLFTADANDPYELGCKVVAKIAGKKLTSEVLDKKTQNN
jgi:hypothetical protein